MEILFVPQDQEIQWEDAWEDGDKHENELCVSSQVRMFLPIRRNVFPRVWDAWM